jgi:hypothetical protein
VTGAHVLDAVAAQRHEGGGMPAISFGPRGERIDGIDGRVSLRSVLETTQILALLVRQGGGAQVQDQTRENITDVVIGS